MELSDEKIRKYIRRIYLSRTRILVNHGFYGLLLMHMPYSIDSSAPTAYTDGMHIAFGPEFLESLTDKELDFIMMHEVLHVVLQHCTRGRGFEPERHNIAADIVVNSNILLENNMDLASISLGNIPSMHLTPNGREGHTYTVEEVYAMLPPIANNSHSLQMQGQHWDDHSHWAASDDDYALCDVWTKRLEDACEAIRIREAAADQDLLPAFAKRLLEELRKPQTDWRAILNDFVQEEIVDYSFAPPDRRFGDSSFFLPDFNDTSDRAGDILFMIDTSGSMSDAMVTSAYSEIKGAIDQFDGKLHGWLGFFDAAIIEPKPFGSEETFRAIKPTGGGGTSFDIIFEYVAQHMADKLPASIIILTDGYASFPQEHLAMGIPVLWLLNNENREPPWGKVARIRI